jgi:hypothetical protein
MFAGVEQDMPGAGWVVGQGALQRQVALPIGPAAAVQRQLTLPNPQ